DNLRPICSGHGYPTQRAANTSRPRSDGFWLRELRVSRTFLDYLRFTGSDHGYPTQCAANTCCPRSDRLWLLELCVSRHFSTFYGPFVQAMDTQLGARRRRIPTIVGRGRWDVRAFVPELGGDVRASS